jgi:hypothetical protein
MTSLSSTSSGAASASAVAVAAASNTCAGDWDWQAWGAVSGLGVGLIFGGALWLLWAILRQRIPSIYSPRTRLLPEE